MTLALNGIPAVSVRILTPWSGAWVADVDLDLGNIPTMPSGPAVLTIETNALQGTIDDRFAGAHGPKGRARVVGGAGGWDKTVTPLHFHNDGGVTTTAVISATGAEVGERPVVAVPAVLGTDFVRTGGPASRVLAGLSWYVDHVSGTTIVGPRALVPMPVDLQVTEWHPDDQMAEVTTSSILVPGTILVSPNFGTAIVRDVEQTFGAAGSSAKCWCSSSTPTGVGGALAQALASIARESTGVPYLRSYRYRVVSEAPDGRLLLQAVSRTAGVPDVVPLSVWPSTAGVTAKLTPGTIVSVEFLEGDPSLPIVTHVEAGSTPIKISLGAGTSPVARGTEVVAALSAIVVYAQALKALGPLAITAPAADALVAALEPLKLEVLSPLVWTE